MNVRLKRRKAILGLFGLACGAAWPRFGFGQDAPSGFGKELLPKKQFVIGHRGACAYAPENTLPSYALAIRQGAEYVEQDLQITKDGVLVCCHDLRLDRVSNAPQVFPNRYQEALVKGEKVKHWYIHDFTLKELKQLDFGAWLDPKWKGTTIPTWDEAIDAIKGKAGLCPETKGPAYYGKLGFDMEKLMVEALKRHDLAEARPNSSTPVFIQSFEKVGLKKLINDFSIHWPCLWLTFVGTKWTDAMLAEARRFVAAIGPYKGDVTADLVTRAHDAGLRVVPYTFRKEDVKGSQDVGTEIRHYLSDLHIDGLFTDNPDQFPR